MTILITGASGFVGKHVAALLADRDVCCLRRDMTHGPGWEKVVSTTKWTGCIHLAWAGIPDDSPEVCKSNVAMTVKLFEALQKAKCPVVVNAGSCFEYGEINGPVTEDDEGGRVSPIGMAKLETFWALQDGELPYRHARIFYAYGPGQREGSLIPSIIKAYDEGREPDIRTPEMAIDLIHVDDVARGLVALLDADCEGGVYNLGSGAPSSVSAVANQVAARYGRAYPLVPMQHGFWAGMSKTEAATGFKATEPFAP